MYKVDLQNLMVLGPSGPLWSFNVIAFLAEKECPPRELARHAARADHGEKAGLSVGFRRR